MGYLARDVSSFPLMIRENYIYVDKTEDIYNLYATKDRYHFLARPRRFGKSLLISTLKELFLGNKELFKGLWIEKSDFQFTEHPLLHFDFLSIAHDTSKDLNASLITVIDEMAKQYDIDISGLNTFVDKLRVLVKKLAKTNAVVILIDEYDHPLLKNIKNLPIAEENQKILKSFYDVIKSLDAYLRAIFITGVTKFAKTSFGCNNLRDISESPEFASILGYTVDEINHYFSDALTSFTKEKKVPLTTLKAEMKTWYNGYRFSEKDLRVYNPYSVVYYLKDQKCANYWFSSGTPSFLVKVLKEDPLALYNLEDSAVQTSSFDAFEVGEVPTLTLLYQSGYLTIKKYERIFNQDTFILGFPNEEIKLSIAVLMLGVLTNQKQPSVESALFRLRMTLYRNDITSFCAALQKLFAQIPYQLHLKQEAYYHSLIQFLVYLLGFDADSEISTSNGRIDLMIRLKTRVFIFEFKLNQPAQSALQQIKDKRYYEKYLSNDKDLSLVGISFNWEDKNLKIDCVFEDITDLPQQR